MEARGFIKGFLESRWGSGTSSGVRRSGSVDLHWTLSHEDKVRYWPPRGGGEVCWKRQVTIEDNVRSSRRMNFA